MEPALIAGGCAFLGAVIGQLLNRNTQRETWLLQKRAEVFSRFLTEFDEYDRECAKLDEIPGYPDEKHRGKILAVDKINLSENLVCFYLSESDKKEFRILVNKRHVFQPDTCNITNWNDLEALNKCWEPLREINENIQSLFERNLAKVSWYDNCG